MTAAAGLDGPDDLVAEDARRQRDLHLAVEQVQVGAADAARVHPQQQLTGSRTRDRALDRPQRAADPLEDHRPHRALCGLLDHAVQ